MSVEQLLHSLFGNSRSARRKSSAIQTQPSSVELLENRALLTLIGMTATVNNTFQATLQTGDVEVPVGGAAKAVVAEGSTDPEFQQFGGIYDIDIDASSIAMTFNLAANTIDPSRVVEPGTFDRYYFKFDVASNETIASAVADQSATLVPNVSIQGDTIVVEVAPGMRIGSGLNALINVQVARIGTVITGRKFHDANNDGAFSNGESWLNGWQVNLIDINQSSNVVDTTTTADIDLNGDGEIDPASERGVYQFVNMPASTYLLQEVDRPGWFASLPASPADVAAYQLDQSVDLQPAGSSFLNWGGLQEQWLFGGGSWYFITPDGTVSQWNGSASDNLTGVPVAQLNADFYNDLSKLYNAASPRQYLVDIDAATNQTHRALDFGNYLSPPNFAFAQNSDQTVTFTWDTATGHTYDVWITDINTGRRHEVAEGVTDSPYVSGILPDRRYRVWMRTQTADAIYSPWSASQEFEFTRNALVAPITGGLNAGIDATPTLTIAAQTGATSYDVRVTNSSGNVVYLGNGGVSHRVATQLRLGNYTASARANYADGSRTAWSAEQALVIDGQPAVTRIGTTFSWAPVTAATQYAVWIDRVDADGNQLQRQIVYVDDLRETSFTQTGLTQGNYSAWVRAIRAEGGTEHYSFWSTRLDFTIGAITEDADTENIALTGLQVPQLTLEDERQPEAEAVRPAGSAKERAVSVEQHVAVATTDEKIVTAVMAELVGSDMLDQA